MGLRERKNARTKEAIERAALELALEQGWEQTTVTQIAARADVSPQTVYVRYGTKDAILSGDPEDTRAIVEQTFAQTEGDAVDAIVAALQAQIAATEDDELAGLRHRVTHTDPYLRRLFTGQLEVVADVIADRLAKDTQLPATDLRVRGFAAAVTGIFVALAERGLDADQDYDVVADVQPGIDFLRHALQHITQSAGP